MKNGIFKRVLALALCVFCAVSFCGCSAFETEVSDLMKAPKLTGEMQPVQEALEKNISTNYSFVFPTYGEYKNAITLYDIDFDGTKEAIAFYSTVIDNTVTLHIAVVDREDGRWRVTAEKSIVAGDIESVRFTDLDGDSREEILVGWNIYGNVEKKVCVYEYTGYSLINLLETEYTKYITCDLNDDFSNDLLVFSINSATGTGTANYYSMTSDSISQLGSCPIDGNVTAHYDPVVSKLDSGKFCVYLDASKGAGLITEIIYFENSTLVNPLYSSDPAFVNPTQRSSIITCQDFDNDGNIEVPIMTALPVEAQFSINEQAYLTVWSGFDGAQFLPKKYTLLNYSDGYYFELTKSELEQITVVRYVEGRERACFSYDYENNRFGKELFRVKAISSAFYQSGNFNDADYKKIAQTEDLVYLLKVSDDAADKGFSFERLTTAFKLFKEE